MLKKLTYLGCITLLTACGGGDDQGSSTPPVIEPNASPVGLWYGETGNGRDALGLVTESGRYYIMYSDIDQLQLAGVAVGTYSMQGDQMQSSDLQDFNAETTTVYTGTATATVVEQFTLNGDIDYTNGNNLAFDLNYDAYYQQSPVAAELTGDYHGLIITEFGTEEVTFTISNVGAITGTSESGCDVQGSTYPATEGNLFDVELTYMTNACAWANQTVRGVLFYDDRFTDIHSVVHRDDLSNGALIRAYKQVN